VWVIVVFVILALVTIIGITCCCVACCRRKSLAAVYTAYPPLTASPQIQAQWVDFGRWCELVPKPHTHTHTHTHRLFTLLQTQGKPCVPRVITFFSFRINRTLFVSDFVNLYIILFFWLKQFDFKKVLYLDPRRMGRLIRNKDTCKLLLYS
jgi:hypothetical protein